MSLRASRWIAVASLVVSLACSYRAWQAWFGGDPWADGSLVVGGGRTLDVFSWCIAALLGWVLACTAWLGALRTGVRLAVLMAGFAAQLALTEPHWLSAARLRPWEWRGVFDGACFAILACEAGFAAWCLRSGWIDRLRHARRAFPTWGTLFVLLLTVSASAHFTLYVPHRKWTALALQVVFALATYVVHGAMLIAIAGAPRRERLQAFAVRCRTWLQRMDRWVPFLLAVCALLTAILVNQLVLEGMYHIPDGAGYLFQARCLAAGKLALEAPPVERAHELYLLTVQDGAWYGITNPGWPAVLAVGAFFGVPWLVNPFLGALTVLLAHGLLSRLTTRRQAHAVTALLVLSPWFLFLNASYMTHSLSLFLVVLAWWGLGRAREGNATFALLAGAAMGWLFLVRPLDGLLVGGFTGVVWWAARRRFEPRVWLYGLGCVGIAALLLPYNAHFTGRPASFPIQVYLDRIWYPGANRLGFGADVGNPPGGWGILDPYPGHGWRDVLLNTNQNLVSLQTELHGFAIGSLTFLLIFVAWGRWNVVDRLALSLLALLLIAYNAYWFSGGPDFGARYWYLVILPALHLTMRGIETVRERWEGSQRTSIVRERLALLVSAACLVACLVFPVWRATTKYVEYRGFHADYVRLAEQESLRGALVFIRSSEQGTYRDVGDADPDPEYSSAFFASDFVHREGPIFLRDLGPAVNAQAVAFWRPRSVRFAVARGVPSGQVPVAGESTVWKRAHLLVESGNHAPRARRGR